MLFLLNFGRSVGVVYFVKSPGGLNNSCPRGGRIVTGENEKSPADSSISRAEVLASIGLHQSKPKLGGTPPVKLEPTTRSKDRLQ